MERAEVQLPKLAIGLVAAVEKHKVSSKKQRSEKNKTTPSSKLHSKKRNRLSKMANYRALFEIPNERNEAEAITRDQ